MRTARSLLSMSLGVFAAFVPAEIHAQQDDAAACFQGRAYDACFREGKKRFAEENYTGAREAYREGWRLQRNYEVAGNLGNVELRLGAHAEAYVHLRYSFDQLPPSRRGTGVEKQLRERMAQALAHVAAYKIALQPPDGSVTVNGKPVAIDAALWTTLPPGVHVLVVEKQGHEPKRMRLTARAGTETKLRIDLPRSTEAPGAEPDGDAGSALQLGVGISGIVLGAGAIAGCIGAALVSASRGDDAARLRAEVEAAAGGANGCGSGSPLEGSATCTELADASADKATLRGVAIGLGVGGGLLLAAGIVYLAIPVASDTPESATVELGPGGIVVRGSF